MPIASTPSSQPSRGEPASPDAAPSTKREEWRSFLFFTIVMAPVLAVMIVGGYGFVVWMYQLLAGPPGG